MPRPLYEEEAPRAHTSINNHKQTESSDKTQSARVRPAQNGLTASGEFVASTNSLRESLTNMQASYGGIGDVSTVPRVIKHPKHLEAMLNLA